MSGAAAATAAPDAAAARCNEPRTRQAHGASAALRDQHPVGDLGPHGQHETFGKEFARGHRGGILTTSMPASARTASNGAAN